MCYNNIMEKIYDVLIIGGGVGGMSAAIYAKRNGKSVLIVEKSALGGQVASLQKIENFPSQKQIDGFSLSQMFASQVKNLGIEVCFDDIQKVNFDGEIKQIFGKKSTYLAKNVVIACGLKSVELDAMDEKFLGNGVSFCAVCDANFFKGQIVCVASKNGSGLGEARVLSAVCKNVILFDSGDLSVFEKNNKISNLQVFSCSKITKILGENVVDGVEVDVDGKVQKFDVKAVFVALGKLPNTKLFEGQLDLDEKGFIKTDENMRTSKNGVFAVGDVRNGVLKQIVTACADGSIAGANV